MPGGPTLSAAWAPMPPQTLPAEEPWQPVEEPPFRNCQTSVDERTYDPRTGTAVIVEVCTYYSISEPGKTWQTRRPLGRVRIPPPAWATVT